ncbi:MarR family winged helix-turn-helix transcriptional regulator [Celerinatantimonas sp. YJH-8]|uniref:MarR family winged helix-turn-helix transcriptional regulator n=1 Tax=Celerinatantimonas sp. YJH-8 TaxID=3228714 RepID=UPI0038CA0F6D
MAYFNIETFNKHGLCLNLGHLIHLTNQYKDKALTKHLMPLDITAQQFKVMLLLYREEAYSCKDLSQRLNIDAGATTRMIDRLEKKQLLLRIRDQHDRRCIQLQLTQEGTQLCQQFPQVIVDGLNEITQGLSTEEIQLLESLLKRLLTTGGVIETPPTDTKTE